MIASSVEKQLLGIRDFKVKILGQIKQYDPRQEYVHSIRMDIQALDYAISLIREKKRGIRNDKR